MNWAILTNIEKRIYQEIQNKKADLKRKAGITLEMEKVKKLKKYVFTVWKY
jgi:hypothetical protein